MNCELCTTQEKQIQDWEEYVRTQLAATCSVERLEQFREIVSKRMSAMKAFGSSGAKDLSMLSPESRKLRANAFKKEGPLDASIFKTFEKRFASYKTQLENAAERLVQCHQEEC